MKPLKTDKIKSSLVKKGFSAENGDHKYYTLYCNGKKTHIFTKVSHGKPEVGEPLLGMMARQVRLNLPRAVKGKKAQKKEKHDFREKGIAKQASTLRRPRNIEITINL